MAFLPSGATATFTDTANEMAVIHIAAAHCHPGAG
jgi:hypothetical protein